MDIDVKKELKSGFAFLKQMLVVIKVLSSALMMWNVAKLVLNVDSPIVVVLTGSMEPAFYRGDLLLVTHLPEDLRAGDIIVFKVPNQQIPIVHRALVMQTKLTEEKTEYVPVRLIDKAAGYLTKEPLKDEFWLLSKGDANPVDDRGLYPRGVMYLNRKHIVGKIRAYCPYVGYLTIKIKETAVAKYAFLTLIVLSIVLSKDPDNK